MSTKKIFIIAFLLLISIALIVGIVLGISFLRAEAEEAAKSDLYNYNIGEMYCNLKDSRRIVKVNPTIVFNNEDLAEILEEKSFLIKDEINKIIRNRSDKDIEGSDGQLTLQNDITKKLIEVFDNTNITNVYFNEFIVQ